MFAVGVDVSNGRSMVAVLGARRSVVVQPHEVPHTADGFAELAARLHALDGEVRSVMEHTGRYYESFAMSMYRAGFFVSAVNPLAIKGYQEGISVRKVKTDKADALKIAQFAIDKWEILPHYTPMDTIRYDLKTLHRQFQLSSKTKTALNNNLIALLEQSYPGANRYFDSPVRPDGSQKWVDFVDTFWHVDCVARVSRKAFVERYQKWCKRQISLKPRLLKSTRMPGKDFRWCPSPIPASSWSGKRLPSSTLFPAQWKHTVPRWIAWLPSFRNTKPSWP